MCTALYVDCATGDQTMTDKDPMQALADMQADAAAEVLSDLSGWPVKDCRFAWEKMSEAATKVRMPGVLQDRAPHR